MNYTLIPDVSSELEIPDEGTLSRVLYRSDRVRVVGFAFDEGQELTEHTASVPAVVQVVRGRLRVTLAGESHEIDEGAWLHMDAGLAHSLLAIAPTVMLLTMLPVPKADD